MNSHLRSILDELYALDPALRAQEKELVPILEKLLKHKPHAEPDPQFVQKLRMMLRDKAASHEASASRSQFSFLNSQFFRMPSLNYAITGAVLGAIITGPAVYGIMQSGGISTLPRDTQEALFSYSVEETSAKAFGDLATVNTSGGFGRGGGGGGGAPAIDAALSAPEASSNDAARMIVPPEMTEYRLKFEGEIPALTAQQIDVLKRQKGTSSADISTIMRSFNTGLLDLDTFDNAKTDMITFYQDVPYGYMVTVSFREGTIGMNANWERWPHPENQCQDEACFRRFRLSIDDVPSDETLISIANSFVREHGINLEQYGEPEVDMLWRANYESAPNKDEFYIPDNIRVVYPQLVDGKPVYDEGGAKFGISIGVNIRENKVSDAWGIMDQKYLKSAYPAVTDAAKITAYLENFGKMPKDWMPPETTVTTVEVTLGTPEMGFMKMYSYENNVGEELIVPALIFPVTNVPAGQYFYRNSVAVPLAADILDKQSQLPDPRPLPVEPIIMEDQPAVAPQE